MTSLNTVDLERGLDLILEEIESLSADHHDIVREAVDAARQQTLSESEARNLFVRILTILRSAGVELDEDGSAALAAAIRAEADELLDARRHAASEPGAGERHGGLVFYQRNGLARRMVVPNPNFNGQSITLFEGYVDVTTLPLWIGNHRVELYVEEFQTINGRAPDADELLSIMHGTLALPSQDDADPFKLRGLAASIARKGVERPPIVRWDGEPKDGNRRIAASRLVLADPNATYEQKERARWIRVWQAPEGTTDDQFEAIVVALNFEPDHKVDWPEYVKARRVVERYRELRDDLPSMPSAKKQLELRKQVAEMFAIEHREVKRYLEMVKWADDFEDYHVTERGLDEAAVRYKANDVFQWFYEVQAGRGSDKLVEKIQQDEALRAIAYDLMFDVLDSGLQVRNLHKVVADHDALEYLKRAHDETDPDEALKFVDIAIAEAQKNSPTRQIAFEQFLQTAVNKLGSTPPERWRDVDDDLLDDLRRVFHASIGAIDGVLAVRSGGASQ